MYQLNEYDVFAFRQIPAPVFGLIIYIFRWMSVRFRCSLNSRDNSRSIGRIPPLYAFLAMAALPSGVRGPVDFSQGRHFWIIAD